MVESFTKELKYFPILVAVLLLTNTMLQFFAISTFLFWAIIKIGLYYKRLPPGPWGVPLLGYLPFMSNKLPHKLYIDMCHKYGDVFSLQLGTNLVVGIGSAKLLKDLFNRPDSTDRPKTPLSSLLGGLGIITSDGCLWKRQRTFLHEKFRSLGVKLCANDRFEKFVIGEVEELFTILDKTKGEPVNPHFIFGRHIHNVICQLMMSFRFENSDEEFVMFNERVTRGMKLFGMVHMGDHFKPYLHLPGKQAIIKEIKRNLVDISQFHANHLKQRVKERKETAGYSEPADLLDCYLDAIEKQKTENKSQIFPDVDPVDQIIQVMNDLFSAGMDTSLSTLLWCMVMMLREPEVAAKIREELRRVVAPGQLITVEHRLLMPYTEAAIFETMRISSVVPLGTIHVNKTAWQVEGHTIPAGTHIIPLINKINMDPEIYPEPEKFKPERFIKNGKCHATEFYQFGVGQRMCLGSLLARMELFLFFANLMHSYEFSLPLGDDMPGLDGVLGTTHSPVPYKLSFTKRDQ
ncbi:cytochrome P450 18a1-like [Anticarsia gemmatalis]|uniref:cytochrome P450 18a1-like n=1 Tax=Anticarsia gemmatalis TaxID=129554 RepID=UPI003F75F7B8